MLFDLSKFTLRKRTIMRAPPPVPDTGWSPPREFPDLRSAQAIAFDVETKEDDFEYGPGWARNAGHIVGFSIAAIFADGSVYAEYFPVRHATGKEDNLDAGACFQWLRDILHTNHIPKIGANLIYDIGWLTEENIFVQGELYDVQFAEALLDDSVTVALDDLAHRYLGESKDTSELYDWIRKAYPETSEKALRGEIWRTPPKLVGKYGKSDALLPLRIFECQRPLLWAQGLWNVFRMECDLIPLLVQMRRAGITVDVMQAERLNAQIKAKIPELYAQIGREYGYTISKTTGAQLAALFDHIGIEYVANMDAKGVMRPSFKKEWLMVHPHPVAKLINTIREHEKVSSTFLESYIIERHHNGKIHCSFNPMKSEDGGAKTGRFSSSDPNLQNIPSRTELGMMVRNAFVADYGHTNWRSYDYSQIEYRVLAHFAIGEGSNELRQAYRDNPKIDYHDKVYYAACPIMGWNPKDAATYKKWRKGPIKNVNFGLLYGQSEKGLAFKAGMTDVEAGQFFEGYHRAAPYVKPTMEAIGDEVQRYGAVTTILGRKVRFNDWEPVGSKGEPVSGYEAALSRYGSNIRRAYAYRGVNYKFQGSGTGDLPKAAMLQMWRSGVLDYVGVPRLQVHDEFGWSQIDDTPAMVEAFKYVQHVMETCVPMNVPIVAEGSTGKSWKECK